ncbi:MAG: hypothetical protein WHV28_00065 [Bacteroidota bacterium]
MKAIITKTLSILLFIIYYLLFIMCNSELANASIPCYNDTTGYNCSPSNPQIQTKTIYFTKENNFYKWNFPDCAITLKYYVQECFDPNFGTFYVIKGLGFSFDSHDPKCNGLDTILYCINCNYPTENLYRIMLLGMNFVINDFVQQNPIPDCNHEELVFSNAWRSCYAFGSYQVQDTTHFEIINCGGEGECCVVYKICWNSDNNSTVTKDMYIDNTNPNIFCPNYPSNVPVYITNINDCKRFCEIDIKYPQD